MTPVGHTGPGESIRRTQAALNRGLAALTTGVIEGQEAVAAENYPIQATEMIQRLQIDVTGKAHRDPIFSEVKVTWPYPFLGRTTRNQTESQQDSPQVATGVECSMDDMLIVDAQVREWILDDNEFVTGAKVRFSAWMPHVKKMTNYAATIHLSFMGYAANAEDDSDEQQVDRSI